MMKENNETVKVMLDDILYLESSSNYIFIYTKAKKIITRQSLEWAEIQLSRHQFMKVHRCFIINLNAVEKMTSKSVWINQTEIPVSRTYSSKINEFLKNGRGS
jgi:two-component system response regulator LytT